MRRDNQRSDGSFCKPLYFFFTSGHAPTAWPLLFCLSFVLIKQPRLILGFQHIHHDVPGGFRAVFLEIAGHHKDAHSKAQLGHTVRPALLFGITVSFTFFSAIGTPFFPQIPETPHFLPCPGSAEVLTGEEDRRTQFQNAVINPLAGGVRRAVQLIQRQVGRYDQGPAAPVPAVDHVVDLFQPVAGVALHPEIVKDQQGIAAEAVNVFVPSLKAGGQVIDLSFPYPSIRLIMPQIPRPAPSAITNVCNTPIALLKNAIVKTSLSAALRRMDLIL